MKTSIKKLTAAFVGTIVGAGLILGLTGCQQNAGNNSGKESGHNAKSTDLIKFNNVQNAKYLATQYAGKLDSNTGRAAARAGEVATEDTLIAVIEDENGNEKEETVIEIPKEELKLADWCKPQPVREIYKCPYPTVEDEAKGVYTVFAEKIDWWQYTDGTKAPNIGQLMYVKPDGKTVDVLNFDGNVERWIMTYIKENDGEDYIQFDENGNLYILVYEYANSKNKPVIYRYNPLNDKVDSYTVDVEGDINIRNFKITQNGKWIFLNVIIDYKYNNVYALQVNSNAKPITMYEFDATDSTDEVTWAVSSIGVNAKTNEVYWYVNEYNSYTRANSGLYIASMSTSGSYSKDNVKFYHGLDEWCWNRAIEYFITTDNKKDYSAALAYLKSFCRPDRKIDDIEFSLYKFKDMKDAPICNPWNEAKTQDFSKLYKEDENGKVLKDEAALKYLFETKYVDVFPESKDWNYDGAEADRNRSLWESSFKDFVHFYYNYKALGESFFNKSNYNYTYYHFPLDFVMFDKGTTNPVTISDNYLKYMNAPGYMISDKGIILANDEGVWVFADHWDDNAKNHTYAQIFNLTDDKGNFTMKEPGSLSELNKTGFKVARDYSYSREETDPWYKSPFAVNTKGFAAISLDQKTIYYHSNGVTKDLLANDSNKNAIGTIYSFSINDDALIYNAVKKNGGYLMVSIDLATGTATKLPIEKKVESMLGL